MPRNRSRRGRGGLQFAPAGESGFLEETQAVAEALLAIPVEALAAVHNHLFEQSAVCSPYETEYEADPFAKARQLADISGFFGAWGLMASSARPTMQDFIGSELEFLSLLSRKEAYTAARNWGCRICRRKPASFAS